MSDIVRIGPIAAFILSARAQGMLPAVAMSEALHRLRLQGHGVITPEIRAQLAAGLQRNVTRGSLGSLGITPRNVVAAGSTGATAAAAAASVSTVAASTLASIGSAIAIGQTAVPIPVVGAAIGAIVGAIAILSQRHVGKAEASWRSPGFYASLNRMNGRDYDEKQFSEAFKGMMDTGNNIVPGCGPDRHKNPDCLLGPMAGVIAQGYLTGQIPLSATTQQVYQTVVQPWLAAGAGGLVNWNNLKNEPVQQLMMRAAADRYLAGQAMTRGDMPSYSNQGAHTPTLLQALQPILQQATTVTAPVPVASAAERSSAASVAQPAAIVSQPATYTTPGVPAYSYPTTPTMQPLPSLAPYNPSLMQPNPFTPQMLPAPIASSGFDFSQWLLPGAIVGGGLLLYKMMGKK